ncbi:PAS domain-containing sensor histidine kinase [Croceicoccus sediminis]|uniref:PAS domain-containing sensor histidine kinase n=1 Tax=Croceicoccus sediminis TaxID=2571150 RepID=UPI001184083E|nr:PAS domain-containing sensor histidine kinase [Croceicoccus sediminis]
MQESNPEASLTWQITPDLLSVIRLDGVFQAVNPAWEKVLGWRQDELEGRSYGDFVHEDDISSSVAAFAKVTGGDPVLEFTNRYRSKDGLYRWLRWVAVPENDLVVCTARDITEDRQNVEVIEEQRSEAELREQFLAVLGHDLRNPLAAVSSGVSILSRRLEDPAHLEVVDGMRQSTSRMVELVNNMMDFARVRLGSGIGLNRQSVTDLSETIRRIVDEMKESTPRADFEVSHKANGAVRLDIPRIEQVLSNLLGNAVTHGDLGKPVRIDCVIEGERLTLMVCNAGPPIGPHARQHLFQPFLRDEVQRSQQGLGLGLFISSEIVKAHGGDLTVLSNDDETCFTIEISG